jgi:hypothetical protein
VSGRWTAKEIHDAVALDVPDEPMADDALFAYLHEVIFERSELSGHPRFMAYVSGAGTIPGTVADLVAAGLNANVGGWQLSPAATEIELHLMRWFASELFGLPEGSGGLVLSGGAMANFVGLKTARDHRAGWNVRLEGLAAHPRLTMYMSTETHVVSSRGADMLGIGTEGVRMIPVDDDYRIRTDALRAAIADDRALGFVPFAIVASAGTVSTGVIDPLSEIATSAGTKGCGSTWMVRTAGRRCSPTTCVRRSRGSSAPTRSRSTRTSGSTRRSPAGASWSDGWPTWRSRSTRTPATSCRTRSTRSTGSTWAGTVRSSRAASGR